MRLPGLYENFEDLSYEACRTPVLEDKRIAVFSASSQAFLGEKIIQICSKLTIKWAIS